MAMNDEKKPVGLSQEVCERLSEILVRKAKSIGVDETSFKDYRRSWMEEYDYSDSDWGDDVSAEELGQMYPN